MLFVTKHACDGQIDRQTDIQTDGQNYYSQDCAKRSTNVSVLSGTPPRALSISIVEIDP